MTIPLPGTNCVRSIGSAALALLLGWWHPPEAGQTSMLIIPPGAQLLISRRVLTDGHPGEWGAPVYVGPVSFVSGEQDGAIPGTATKWPTVTIYLEYLEPATPAPLVQPPQGSPPPAPPPRDPGVTPKGDGQP